MHANDLVSDLESIKSRYAAPLAREIDSHQDDEDDKEDAVSSESEAMSQFKAASKEFGIELVLNHVNDKEDATDIVKKLGQLLCEMEVDAMEGEFIINVYHSQGDEKEIGPADQGRACRRCR